MKNFPKQKYDSQSESAVFEWSIMILLYWGETVRLFPVSVAMDYPTREMVKQELPINDWN